MRISSSVLAILLGIAAMLGTGIAPAEEPGHEPLSAFPQSLLAVRTAAGRVINFKIWTADTPRREEQGLMYVHSLDEHAGMLFMFDGMQSPMMWMKNTYIPLDMLFIDAQGRIVHIAANAEPLSLAIIQSPKPSRAVLELKGGICADLGIQAGDSVIYAGFHKPN